MTESQNNKNIPKITTTGYSNFQQYFIDCLISENDDSVPIINKNTTKLETLQLWHSFLSSNVLGHIYTGTLKEVLKWNWERKIYYDDEIPQIKEIESKDKNIRMFEIKYHNEIQILKQFIKI